MGAAEGATYRLSERGTRRTILESSLRAARGGLAGIESRIDVMAVARHDRTRYLWDETPITKLDCANDSYHVSILWTRDRCRGSRRAGIGRHTFPQGASMRQRLTFGSALLALLVVGWNNGAGAQRVAPVAISTTRAPGPRQVEMLHASALTFRVAPASRAEHAAWGALAGAVVGGVVGFLIHQEDHTGESLNAPVLISAGAVLGACVGAIIGVMIPTE